MAIDPNIKKKADDIRSKIYGKEVRESLASGLEEMSSDVIKNEGRQSVVEGRQDSVETQWQAVSDEMTDKDVISAPEIIAARDGEADLKTRLDKENQEVTAQLAQTAKKSELTAVSSDVAREKLKSNYVRHGLLNYPSAFTHPGVNIFRDTNGKVQHDFNLEQFRTGEKEIFYSITGVDTTGDGSREKPYRLPIYALEKAIEAPESKVVIKALTPLTEYIGFTREGARPKIPTGKTISFVPDNAENKIRFVNGRNSGSLSWVADNGIYKAARSATNMVIDFKRLDAYGVAIPYDKKGTLADCIATPYSWYTDGASVWVNRNNQSMDDDVWLLLEGKSFWADISGSTMYLENVEFYHASSSTDACDIVGNLNSTFINNKCLFVGGNIFDANIGIGNGLGIKGVGKTYSFNSVCAYNALDGFNYHYTTIPTADRRKCTVFEYDCIGYKSGVYRTMQNNNASTGHEGCTIFRIGTIGFETNGPVVADVNGCNVYCIDTHPRKSLINNLTHGGSAAFFFDNSAATSLGVAYLENCSGGGANTYAISSDGNFDIKLLGFDGTKFTNSIFDKITAVEDIV